MLQSMGWQRVGHDLVTEQQHTPISLKGQLKGIQAHWEWKLWHQDLGALCPQVSIQWTSVEWMNELYINYRLWPLYFLYVSYFRILKNKSDWLNPDNIYIMNWFIWNQMDLPRYNQLWPPGWTCCTNSIVQIALWDRVCGRQIPPKAIWIKQAPHLDFSLQFFFAKEVTKVPHQCG